MSCDLTNLVAYGAINRCFSVWAMSYQDSLTYDEFNRPYRTCLIAFIELGSILLDDWRVSCPSMTGVQYLGAA